MQLSRKFARHVQSSGLIPQPWNKQVDMVAQCVIPVLGRCEDDVQKFKVGHWLRSHLSQTWDT